MGNSGGASAKAEMTEFFWRIWIAVILVTLVVLALFVLLATLQFQNINSGLTSERLAVLADRTAEPFHAPAKIGVPLSAVRNATALLERARQTDREILAVHVFDAKGDVVHSTATPAPESIPPQAINALRNSDNRRWQLMTGTTFISGVNILDISGSIAGGVMIVYPTTGHLTQVRAMAAELGFAALGGLIGVAVVAAALLRVTLRRLFHKFQRIENEISEFERGAWRSAAGGTDAGHGDETEAGSLHQLLPEAEATYRRTGKQLSKLAPVSRGEL